MRQQGNAGSTAGLSTKRAMKAAKNTSQSHPAGPCDTVKLVEELLDRAIRCGASDVHFEPGQTSLAVRFRLDGVLSTVETLPAVVADNVIARLKVLAGLLTYRNDIPQEGRIDTALSRSNGLLDRRVAVFPTLYGQRAVVRMLYKNEQLADLDRLGFPLAILAGLKAVACGNQGLLLMTGPAGSGKSTTLAALLRYIIARFPGKSVVTLEDPVEIRIDGAAQTPITPHGQMTFPTALRSLLRQDPQVLMIGEIRDAETAHIAIEAALTGHLLMSTLHSGTCAGALVRLLEMGVEPYQVTSSISAVVNQRLIRRLCTRCRRAADNGYEAVGCESCLGTGFKGRVLVAEMVRLDSRLRQAILDKSDLGALDGLIRRQGYAYILQDARRLIAEGVTTQQEIDSIGLIMADSEQSR